MISDNFSQGCRQQAVLKAVCSSRGLAVITPHNFQTTALALTMVLPVLTMLRTVLMTMAAARASRPAAAVGSICAALVHTG